MGLWSKLIFALHPMASVAFGEGSIALSNTLHAIIKWVYLIRLFNQILNFLEHGSGTFNKNMTLKDIKNQYATLTHGHSIKVNSRPPVKWYMQKNIGQALSRCVTIKLISSTFHIVQSVQTCLLTIYKIIQPIEESPCITFTRIDFC